MPSIPGDSGVTTGVVPVAPQPNAFSQWLDGLRWIAALSVVLAHCNNRFLVHITDVPRAQRPVLFYVFAFFAGFAHEAVMVFFVLSGYLVGGGLWKEHVRTGSIRMGSYMLKRVSRLCIVLYPAFLLIAALNLTGVYGLHGLSSGAYDSLALQRTGAGTLVCNAAFLQTVTCDPYGSDGALWSLFNEFWYYVLWPLLVLAWFANHAGKRLGWLLFMGALLLALTLLPLGMPLHAPQPSWIAAYMLIWLLGVLVAARPEPFISSTLASSLLVGAVLLGSRLLVRRSLADEHPGKQFLVDLVLGLVFTNLLLTMKHDRRLPKPPLGSRNGFLAGFSFSLYCIHIPILNLYAAAIRRVTGNDALILPEHPGQWLIILGAIACSVIGGYLFSLLTEAHTLQFRRWLESAIALMHTPVSSATD